MIISRRSQKLILVDQVEHALLCGTFAERWGNEGFAPVTPLEPVRLAATIHDDGWLEPDGEPLYNEGEARPLNFVELGHPAHMRMYKRGVDHAFERDPYAGLLVSMHWTGLYRSRWGMPSGNVAPTEPAPEDAAIEDEERRWSAVKHELCRTMRRSDLEIGLWHNYDLLQAWDLLSLYVCLIDLTPSSGVAPRPVAATLAAIAQQPGPRTIPSVPRAVGAQRAQLTLTPIDAGVVRVEPYPFDVGELECVVAAKALEDRSYRDAADCEAAFASAPSVALRCLLVS